MGISKEILDENFLALEGVEGNYSKPSIQFLYSISLNCLLVGRDVSSLYDIIHLFSCA